MTPANPSKSSKNRSREPRFQPAPHLNEGSIVEYELKTAMSLRESLEEGLRKLKKKTSKERIHKSRVALRRWFSVWSLLQEEGWDSEDFAEQRIQPLKNLLKAMGATRDIDVGLEKATALGCSDSLQKKLTKQRKKKEKALQKQLKHICPVAISEAIGVYLVQRAELLGKAPTLTPYEVLDEHLQEQEQKVKKLTKKASTPEALHKARLAIKKWRYLLTECMGLTNFDLIKAQTVLGEMHDLDRLELVLEKHGESEPVFNHLRSARAELFREWMRVRDNLPYGLRPGITTLKA